jgi:hypothetical protein
MELLWRGHVFQPPLSSYGDFKSNENHLPRVPLRLDLMLRRRVSFPLPDFPHTSSPEQGNNEKC